MLKRALTNFLPQLRYFSSANRIETLNPPGLKVGNYSYAKKVNSNANLIFVSGCVPIHPQTGHKPDDIVNQTNLAMENLVRILEYSNSSVEDIVKCTAYLTDMTNYDAFNTEYKKWFKTNDMPARVCVAVKELPFGVKVEVEAIAIESKK